VPAHSEVSGRKECVIGIGKYSQKRPLSMGEKRWGEECSRGVSNDEISWGGWHKRDDSIRGRAEEFSALDEVDEVKLFGYQELADQLDPEGKVKRSLYNRSQNL